MKATKRGTASRRLALGGSPAIATLPWTSTRLCAGFFSVHDTSGAGMRVFTGLRGRAARVHLAEAVLYA